MDDLDKRTDELYLFLYPDFADENGNVAKHDRETLCWQQMKARIALRDFRDVLFDEVPPFCWIEKINGYIARKLTNVRKNKL